MSDLIKYKPDLRIDPEELVRATASLRMNIEKFKLNSLMVEKRMKKEAETVNHTLHNMMKALSEFTTGTIRRGTTEYSLRIGNIQITNTYPNSLPEVELTGWITGAVDTMYLDTDGIKLQVNEAFGGNVIYDYSQSFSYKKVIFNNPATIVYWNDGTKTVVKCLPGETYDKEKGLALCFMKKAMGNKGNYNNIFRKELGWKRRKKKKNLLLLEDKQLKKEETHEKTENS